jgi:uncharacterized protein
MAAIGPSEEAGEGDFVIRVAQSLAAFDAAEWNALSGASKGGPEPYNPFVSHAFLSALEESGCATAQSGWLGQHLRLEGPGGRLIGAVPAYLKSHSQGEYVFDHGWADAFERAGGRYYPEAPGLGALHAGCRTAASGGARGRKPGCRAPGAGGIG